MSSSSASDEDALEYNMSEDLEDSPAVISPPPSSKPEKGDKYKNSLLNVLHDYHSELPLDGRTLLKTSRKSEIVKFSSGEFCYYGIAKYLQNADLRVICSDHHIQLRINIDGLPLCRSSGTQF
ncbi:hypothetical protein AVEN_95537-1 [Araneus ventricosus]|uniref:Uncharacterized protein n=1 Tax=Araneus ventricosus TaxID=182803 RepID=A0A4Y2SI92_ARAVE|nr:hypothetical protein AVEN_95537-1 [Araneus ventricosus]